MPAPALRPLASAQAAPAPAAVLVAEGPNRLVLPGDGRPARWVRQLPALAARRAP